MLRARLSRPRAAAALAPVLDQLKPPLTRLPPEAFDPATARAALVERFGPAEFSDAIAAAAGAALRYAEENFGGNLSHLRPPRLYRAAEFMLVDDTTRRHLELVSSSDGTRAGSLLSILDETLTPVGARLLANWIVYPLMDLEAIGMRHDAVDELFESDLGGPVADALQRIGDLERLAGRVGSLRASPRDTLKLGTGAERGRDAQAVRWPGAAARRCGGSRRGSIRSPRWRHRSTRPSARSRR